ncbi:MAG: hypothetical protein JST59_08025 [Actinobacteria bacterium]|nr:hypothetical protein [Actinomycetota bacterium]
MTYVIPFSIPFQAPMSCKQVEWLRQELSLTFHPNAVLDPDFPYAFGSLDRFSGLYLVKGSGEHWTLECRTYRKPMAEEVASWEARTGWVIDALGRR